MVARKKRGSLTDSEKPIVKALLAKGWRNQDIQALVNIGREDTVNGARITGVKQNSSIVTADEDEVEFFLIRKRSYNLQTGLNLYDHERLIRAREAMILAVQIFNSPAVDFKTEVFTMLTNVAWTYLLHEHYARKGINILGKEGRSLLLSQMLDRQDCPLTTGIKDNLRTIKILRDNVEHKLLGRADIKWSGLFQACCLNFDKTICELFGSKLSLAHDLSFAIQFTKMDFDQLVTLNRYEIPAHINAVDARLTEGMTDAQIANLEYRFRVVYTQDAVTKSQAHIQFIHPASAEGKDIRNVLVKHMLTDQLYPFKPGKVRDLVKEKTQKPFTLRDHAQAWRKFSARPRGGAMQPENTNKQYCVYHHAHKDYTYSQKWVDLLISVVADDEKRAELKSFA